MILKNNSISDRDIILKLEEASCAGVRIDMIVRGICCVRAGVPGKTENLHIRSLVGRYLEHGRIYSFYDGVNTRIYIASGDFLTRNTECRVEVGVRVEDPVLKEKLDSILRLQLSDNVNAREMQPDGSYQKVKPAPGRAAGEQPDGNVRPSPRRLDGPRQSACTGLCRRDAEAPARQGSGKACRTGKGSTSTRRTGKTASTAGKGRSRPDAHRRHREPPPTHRSAEPPARALPEIIPDASGLQGWRHFILSCRIQYRKQEGRRWGQDSIKQRMGDFCGVLRCPVLRGRSAGLCRKAAPEGCSLKRVRPAQTAWFPLGTTAWRVSDAYGWRTDPITGEEAFHRGTDLACSEGTLVLAAMNGVVIAPGGARPTATTSA